MLLSGKTLRDWRYEIGNLPRRVVARSLGVSESKYARWERKEGDLKKVLRVSDAQKLASFYGVNVSYFFSDKCEKN